MQLYSLDFLRSAKPPKDAVDGKWWQYEISCEISKHSAVRGMIAGEQPEVEVYLEKLIKSINSRLNGKMSKNISLVGTVPSQKTIYPAIRTNLYSGPLPQQEEAYRADE